LGHCQESDLLDQGLRYVEVVLGLGFGFVLIEYIVEYIIESGKREKREWKHIIDYIVLSSILKMNIRVSLYKRERGALASNFTNVRQAPHIH
jgi:multisubunit Na+/H+ antiporter MnhE subunit